MSVEIANNVHAIAVFTSANPPVLDKTRSRGVSADPTRGGAGTFQLVLEQPLKPANGVVAGATISPNATAGTVNAELDADGNLDVITKSAVNTAADGGTVTVLVLRLPTIS